MYKVPMSRDKYANQHKHEEARVPIWSLLSKSYKGGNVLFLPEKTRTELDVILSQGIESDKLFAVDKSPAVIATFTRTLSATERGNITRRGVLVSDACKGWTKQGLKFEIAHLDFCGNVEGWNEGSPRQELEEIARTGVIDNCRIAVTVLKGRETRATTKQFNRVSLLAGALNKGLSFRGSHSVKLLDSRSYQNGPSPMLWVAFEIKEK